MDDRAEAGAAMDAAAVARAEAARADEACERLAAALARIADVLDRPPGPTPAALAEAEARATAAEEKLAALEAEAAGNDLVGEVAELTQRLEEESLAHAQLRARTDALAARLQAAEAEAAALRADLVARDQLAAQFRRVNAQLRQNNLSLREANAKGLPDSRLINRAMLNELESIRASRDADRAEIDAVLADLNDLLSEDADA